MRRAPALFVVVGVAAGLTGLPVQARDVQTATPGFWVSLASGAAGSSTSSGYNDFWFDSPHAPPISVNSIAGAGTVQASTAGGSTFFTSIGTPVLLPTTDGYATLSASGSSFPSSALPKFAGGSQASGAPVGGGSMPSSADQLSLSLSAPAANGSQVLSVSVTSPTGASLGHGSVTVPDNGWWVVGLGPGDSTPTTTTGGGSSGGSIGGSSGGGTTVTVPVPPTSGSGSHGSGSIGTPEPTSMVLLGLGGVTSAGWRLRRRLG